MLIILTFTLFRVIYTRGINENKKKDLQSLVCLLVRNDFKIAKKERSERSRENIEGTAKDSRKELHLCMGEKEAKE